MRLLNELVKQKPREKSGSSSSNRFSYQVDWAFAQLVALHRANKDYLIILDLHDDVVIADSYTNPNRLDFYQVKTDRNNEWSQARLLRRAPAKKGTKKRAFSILGKLFEHRLKFPNNPGTLSFVSNMRCSLRFDSRCKNQREIFFGKLITACRREIAEQLRDEHDLAKTPNCDESIRFLLTDLDLDKHSRDVQGDIAEFGAEVSADGNFPVTAFYRAIAEELRSRSNLEEIPSTVEELLEKKAISSADVKEILDQHTPVPSMKSLWQNAHQALLMAQMPPFRILAIQSSWMRYGIQRRDPNNKVVQQLGRRIAKALLEVEAVGAAGTPVTYMDIAMAAAQLIRPVNKLFTGDDLAGAILLELFDGSYRKLSATNSQPPGEAA